MQLADGEDGGGGGPFMGLAMEEGEKKALTGGGGVSGGGTDVGGDEQGGAKKGETKGLAQTMGAGADDVLALVKGGEPVEQMTEEEEQESDDEVDVRVCPPPPTRLPLCCSMRALFLSSPVFLTHTLSLPTSLPISRLLLLARSLQVDLKHKHTHALMHTCTHTRTHTHTNTHALSSCSLSHTHRHIHIHMHITR